MSPNGHRFCSDDHPDLRQLSFGTPQIHGRAVTYQAEVSDARDQDGPVLTLTVTGRLTRGVRKAIAKQDAPPAPLLLAGFPEPGPGDDGKPREPAGGYGVELVVRDPIPGCPAYSGMKSLDPYVPCYKEGTLEPGERHTYEAVSGKVILAVITAKMGTLRILHRKTVITEGPPKKIWAKTLTIANNSKTKAAAYKLVGKYKRIA